MRTPFAQLFYPLKPFLNSSVNIEVHSAAPNADVEIYNIGRFNNTANEPRKHFFADPATFGYQRPEMNRPKIATLAVGAIVNNVAGVEYYLRLKKTSKFNHDADRLLNTTREYRFRSTGAHTNINVLNAWATAINNDVHSPVSAVVLTNINETALVGVDTSLLTAATIANGIYSPTAGVNEDNVPGVYQTNIVNNGPVVAHEVKFRVNAFDNGVAKNGVVEMFVLNPGFAAVAPTTADVATDVAVQAGGTFVAAALNAVTTVTGATPTIVFYSRNLPDSHFKPQYEDFEVGYDTLQFTTPVLTVTQAFSEGINTYRKMLFEINGPYNSPLIPQVNVSPFMDGQISVYRVSLREAQRMQRPPQMAEDFIDHLIICNETDPRWGVPLTGWDVIWRTNVGQ
jgi:hypothetical protein